jgi:hypothetical protein
MPLERSALLIVARVRETMRAEREAAIAEMQRDFAAEANAIRVEMLAARRELAAVRLELRSMNDVTPAELKNLEKSDEYISAVVDALQRAANVSSPLAVAIALVRTGRALAASDQTSKTYFALELARTALELDPDIASVRWQ